MKGHERGTVVLATLESSLVEGWITARLQEFCCFLLLTAVFIMLFWGITTLFCGMHLLLRGVPLCTRVVESWTRIRCTGSSGVVPCSMSLSLVSWASVSATVSAEIVCVCGGADRASVR